MEIVNSILDVERVVKDRPEKYSNESTVLLIDADSIAYLSNYGTEEDLDEAKFRVDKKLQEIVTEIEKSFNIKKTMVFVKGEKNFRYKVFSEYKASRKKVERHPNIELLIQYMIDKWNAYPSDKAEADDYIYTIWSLLKEKGTEQCIIASNDKDMKANCYGWFYDYRSYKDTLGKFIYVDEIDMIYNFRIQMLIGDAGDGINETKGFGIKSAQKIIYEGMSDYHFTKELIKVYQKFHGDQYKEKIKMCYNLLKLHNVTDENFKKLIQ
jgi:5'-3' exonuclease